MGREAYFSESALGTAWEWAENGWNPVGKSWETPAVRKFPGKKWEISALVLSVYILCVVVQSSARFSRLSTKVPIKSCACSMDLAGWDRKFP